LTEFYESSPLSYSTDLSSLKPTIPEKTAHDLVGISSDFASKGKNPSLNPSNTTRKELSQKQDNSVQTVVNASPQSFKHENRNSCQTQTLQPDLPNFQGFRSNLQAPLHPSNLPSGFFPVAPLLYYQIQGPNIISGGSQGILVFHPIPTSTQVIIKHQDQAFLCFQPVHQMSNQNFPMPNLGVQNVVFQREDNKTNRNQEYPFFNSSVEIVKDVGPINNHGVAKNNSGLN